MCAENPQSPADARHNGSPYDLERFVLAQTPVFQRVLSELKAGRKVSHWMWFIFPQIQGLGRSPISIEYAISGIDEARAYLEHPSLGARLRECTLLVLMLEGRSATEIFGSPDDLKFRSSMTLFAEASPEEVIFLEALQKYFNGERDRLTLDRL